MSTKLTAIPGAVIPSLSAAGWTHPLASTTSFVGRRAEVAAVVALLLDPGVRLVTLTGPGGVGKTRLATAVAERLREEFPEGIAFVALSSIRDPEQVATAMARAIGIQAVAGGVAVDAIAVRLGTTRALIVVDNLEQVLEAVPVIAELVRRCPRTSVLATSRERLRIAGERVFPVPPLATVAADGEPSEAARLFVERSHEVAPDLAVADAAAVVARICGRLDGLPLAIELAAARLTLLTPEVLLARLEQRLPLLTGGPREAPDRHRTLRNTIAWSYDLLTPEEQACFRALAVFPDSFSLEAAGAVIRGIALRDEGERGGRDRGPGGRGKKKNDAPVHCPPPPHGEAVSPSPPQPAGLSPSDLDLVGSLVEKTLLQRTVGPGGDVRLRMLETIREFALEMLEGAGEGDGAREAHAGYALAFAEEHRLVSGHPVGAETVARVTTEWPTLLAALEWLTATGAEVRFSAMAVALAEYWYVTGDVQVGRFWIERVLSTGADIPPATRVSLTAILSVIALTQGETALAERLGAQGLALARHGGDDRSICRTLVASGCAAVALGDYERAAQHLTEALALIRREGNEHRADDLASSALANLGVAMHCLGRLEEANAYHLEALAGFRARGSARGEMIALSDLGDLSLDRGTFAMAAEHYQASLRLAAPYGEKRVVGEALTGIACATAVADPEQATRLFAAAERLRAEAGIVTWLPFIKTASERGIAAARTALDDQAFAAAWAAGDAMPLEQAITAALTVPKDASASISSPLTARERDVLRLMADGKSDRAIGEALFMGLRTAEWHVGRICAKLGVSSRTAAAAKAIAAGLIEHPPGTSSPCSKGGPPGE